MMAAMRKRKILAKLMAIAALCATAGLQAFAQAASATGADSGNAAAAPQSPDVVSYCDRYAGSEFDSESSVFGLPFERIDPKVAIPACAEALAKNPDSPRLNFQLGRAYSARGEFSKARAFFLKAAQANFALAEVDLGSFYFNGLGAPRDYEEAVKWDRLAADQGLAPAQSNLGIMYLEGRGVAQDSTEAAKWLQAAAAQGFAPAQYSLAALYASGKGVKPNFAEAQRLYGLAANQGYAPAEAGFPWTEAEGQSLDRRYGEAGKGADSTAGDETEPARPTPDRQSSNEPDEARNGPPEGSDDSGRATQPSSPAVASSPSEPGPRPNGLVAARPSPAIFLQGRLEGDGSGGDQPPVNIVVKLLDHRNSSGVPTVAIEVSPRSNQFSMSGLSVNDGACRVYIQDPAIFSQGRRPDPATKSDSNSDRSSKDLAAALAKIALPKIPFDQPMVAEFGQYLQFYTDPSLCDVRQVAVVVNAHEWRWLSTSGIPVAASPKSDDRMGQSPNPAPEAKP